MRRMRRDPTSERLVRDAAGRQTRSIPEASQSPDSVAYLGGLEVGAEEFLAAVLQTAAQPIWVMDHAGMIRFANPAAVEALGYVSADELLGRDSHDTIHYKHPDGSPYLAADCPMLCPRVTGETVASDRDWFFRRDGSMFPVSYASVPLEMPGGRGAVVAFTDIEDRLHAEQVLRERDAVLGTQQSSLRRIATLVAGGAASGEVFAAIAREVARVLGLPTVQVWRYEPDGAATVLGSWSERPHPFQAGTRWPLDDLTILVRDTRRPMRIDDVGDLPGTIADAVRDAGVRSGAGAPIIVDGDVWGLMATAPHAHERLPDHIENRLAEFTELVATAISTTAGREQVARLAEEQSALRRVATVVAREAPLAQIFTVVGEELTRLLGVEHLKLTRFDDDGMLTIVADWGEPHLGIPVGTRLPLGGENLATLVLRTGQPARIDDYAKATGTAADYARGLGVRAGVACPITVEGRLWGCVIAASPRAEPLPAGTEPRIGEFTALVATGISNIQARSELAASRARIVAATDEERRRVVRDLHDGAQQRLVHTIITLEMAREALRDEPGPGLELVTEALEHAKQAATELRELARGFLPRVLTQDGLRAGVQALASRMALPVTNGVAEGRLPAAVEATAYFVVAEALTNVAKHAGAQHAAVTAQVEDGTLTVHVRDDGAGGARPDGNGLQGLADRLSVLDGRLRVESPADGGTLVTAAIPLPE
jgi:PAS domain S-box-containing protein